MVPIDPSSVAQAYGGDSSKNLMITRPGLLPVVGEELLLCVWCEWGAFEDLW